MDQASNSNDDGESTSTITEITGFRSEAVYDVVDGSPYVGPGQVDAEFLELAHVLSALSLDPLPSETNYGEYVVYEMSLEISRMLRNEHTRGLFLLRGGNRGTLFNRAVTKVATYATAVMILGGGAAAAATGVFPRPIQHFISSTARVVGLSLPTGSPQLGQHQDLGLSVPVVNELRLSNATTSPATQVPSIPSVTSTTQLQVPAAS